MKDYCQSIKRNFIVCFLPFFMWFIFGPMEIYMGNVNQFVFGYKDFFFVLSFIGIVGAVVLATIISFLPEKFQKISRIVVSSFSVGSYIQVMWLNSGIDLLGVVAEANVISEVKALKNGLVWFVVFVLIAVISFKLNEKEKTLTKSISAFLLAVQVVALLSLIVSSQPGSYSKSYDDVWYITDEGQCTLSSQDNIIVIVLDFFSNQYIEPMLAEYPDALDGFSDFTYYDNADCMYFGTFPSLAHLATGQELDTSVPVNEWFNNIWSSHNTRSYYKLLQDNGYRCRFYTDDQTYLCGTNEVSILDGCIDNIGIKSYSPNVKLSKLLKNMTKMSGYRMVPYILKPLLYTSFDNKYSMIQKPEGTATVSNTDYYNNIVNGEFTLDDNAKYYTFQHLTGDHYLSTACDGTESTDPSLEENSAGCMFIMSAYFGMLKDMGIYDNSTIIITSDHGGPRDSQPILFVKKKNEMHDEMYINHAPVSFAEFQATIVAATGTDESSFGMTFSDVPDEPRKREVFVREMIDGYPKVYKYDAKQVSTLNAYSVYTYTGNIEELLEAYDNGSSYIIPMVDSFY